MMKVLRLFPDTNVFIQCRPLEDLDWSPWAGFDEIELVVCRPVQREIDYQKGRGNDRVGRQARRVNALFREIITGTEGYKLIRDAGPAVKLLVEPQWAPGPKLKDRLDYGKPDDKLVGCLHAYRMANPGTDARLLTHDSGPMGTAKMLDLPFVAVPDDWLKPPERTADERDKERLEAEVRRLRKAEPEFQIRCLDEEGSETGSLTFEYPRYEPLTGEDIASLMERLRAAFPLETDFGPTEPAEREPTSRFAFSVVKEVYTPASEEDIATYTDEKYPAWLESCEAIFKHLHVSLQRKAVQPAFCFAAVNVGSRPGKDALITFTAKGSLFIRPQQRRGDDEEDDRADAKSESPSVEAPSLPSAPVPPRGKWSPRLPGPTGDPLSATDQLQLMQRQMDPLGSILSTVREPYLPSLSLPEHDPNAFYYKDRRSMIPGSSFSLECDQWRHSLDEEYFDGEIFFERDSDKIQGALECLIHAENLSDPARKTVPVTISIKAVRARDHAETMLEELIRYTSRA